MRSTNTLLLAAVAVAATARAARADDDAAAPAAAERLVLPAGRGLVQALAAVDLSAGAVADRISLQPDVWYGASDVLTVGLVHSGRGATGFTGDVDRGLCLTGRSHGCEALYSSVGVDVRYHLADAPLALAVDGGLHVGDWKPFQLAVKLGAVGRWHGGKLAVEVAPSLFVGVTERTPDPTVSTVLNKDAIDLPVTLLYRVVTKASIALQTGVALPLEGTGDGWALPVSVGVQVAATRDVFADLTFSLPQLAGGSATAGLDARSLTIGGGYAF